jgi:hypothetical protein
VGDGATAAKHDDVMQLLNLLVLDEYVLLLGLVYGSSSSGCVTILKHS